MASIEISNFESEITTQTLISNVMEIHDKLSGLESLQPSKATNSLFTQLVNLCIIPSSIDIEKDLKGDHRAKRESLIVLSGRGECLLELEFAIFLSKTPKAINNINLFPYYNNYVKLARYEYNILARNGILKPKKIAFVGSGPMPLTSFVLAINHFKTTHFDNFDFDERANSLAREIVSSDVELEKRMIFETSDVMDLKDKLGEYDCVFLAALVGMKKEEKVMILGHLRKYMKEGGFLLVRSAKGARAFLYPIIEEHDLLGFEVLDIFHPTDDVINSVFLARKPIF